MGRGKTIMILTSCLHYKQEIGNVVTGNTWSSSNKAPNFFPSFLLNANQILGDSELAHVASQTIMPERLI